MTAGGGMCKGMKIGCNRALPRHFSTKIRRSGYKQDHDHLFSCDDILEPLSHQSPYSSSKQYGNDRVYESLVAPLS